MGQYEDWAMESTRRWPKIFALAEAFLDEAKKLANAGELRQGDHLGIIRALLFGRVLSGTKGLVLLASHGLLVEADSQFRSNMEALFRLAALIENELLLPEYLGEDFQRRRRAMEDVRNLIRGAAPAAGLPTEGEIDEALREIDREANEFLRVSGLNRFREIKVWEWARVGQQSDFFYGKYLLHSGVTHHAARDLERRLRFSDDGEEIKAIVFCPDTESPEGVIVDGLYLLARAMDAYARSNGVEITANAWTLKHQLEGFLAE
jgi:hypothetical protein